MTPEELRASIVPKSDQLNADSLLAGPITVQIESVKAGDSKEQPVSIGIGKEHQPYKPCKSMRRVLIAAWGDQGKEWVGKSMTLYCDPEVSFGGVKVGGIRISHLSHMESDREFMLTRAKGKKSGFSVRKLVARKEPETLTPEQVQAAKVEADQKCNRCNTVEELLALYNSLPAQVQTACKPLFGTRRKVIEGDKTTLERQKYEGFIASVDPQDADAVSDLTLLIEGLPPELSGVLLPMLRGKVNHAGAAA